MELLEELILSVSCALCKHAREVESMCFYRECGHYFCNFCIKEELFCPKCDHFGQKQLLVNEPRMIPIYKDICGLLTADEDNGYIETPEKTQSCNSSVPDLETKALSNAKVSYDRIPNISSPRKRTYTSTACYNDGSLNQHVYESAEKLPSPNKHPVGKTVLTKKSTQAADKSVNLLPSRRSLRQISIPSPVKNQHSEVNESHLATPKKKPNSTRRSRSPRIAPNATDKPVNLVQDYQALLKTLIDLPSEDFTVPIKYKRPSRAAKNIKSSNTSEGTPNKTRTRSNNSNNSNQTPVKRKGGSTRTRTPARKSSKRRQVTDVVKTTPRRNGSSPQITSKKNAKGETPLHLAVKQSNSMITIQNLLDLKADPNCQDFANWTPLHDAVHMGNIPIVDYLLNHGALADVPGFEHKTPLHLAVELNNIPIVKLLIGAGANPNAKDLYGNTPRNLTEDPAVIAALLEKDVFPPSVTIPVFENIILFGLKLPADEVHQLQSFAKHFGIAEKRDIFDATHVIVSKNATFTNFDWSLARVMVNGSLIISSQWCEDSLTAGNIEDPLKYQLQPAWLPGLQNARTNAIWRRPGLFSGFQIMIGDFSARMHQMRSYRINEGNIDLKELAMFVQRAGGKLLTRMPDPESPLQKKIFPYHAKPGPMEHCSQLVIYLPQVWEAPIKYNMSHLKCLPIQWLINCITNFEIISDTSKY